MGNTKEADRLQSLHRDVLNARTPAEQLAAEKRLREALQPGDESGNFTVPRADDPPARFPNATGNFTVPADNGGTK